MGAGKTFSIIAGIISLISMFFLTWYVKLEDGVLKLAYGIVGFRSIPHMFVYPGLYGTPYWVTYIFAGLFIWLLISPFIQFGGVKHQFISILGATMPILIATIILLSGFGGPIPPLMSYVDAFLESEVLIPGIIPLTYEIPGTFYPIGVYGVLTGGVLSLIAGFIPRKKKE